MHGAASGSAGARTCLRSQRGLAQCRVSLGTDVMGSCGLVASHGQATVKVLKGARSAPPVLWGRRLPPMDSWIGRQRRRLGQLRPSPARATIRLMKLLTWPTLDPDHQWLTAALEKSMLESNQTPEELRAEAQRVRTEAEHADMDVIREALLTVAANFESVAVGRLAA